MENIDLKVRFVLPPVSQHIAGIKNAVDGLFDSLQNKGVNVIEGGDIYDTTCIHHFHGLWHPSHARLAAKLRRQGKPYVVSPHGMLEPWALQYQRWKKIPYFRLIEKRYLLGADALFVTSEMEAKNLTHVISHPYIECIHIGCHDPERPDYASARKVLNWKEGEKVMLFLSRIDVVKGLNMLIQALSDLPEYQKAWRLVVVGDGEAEYVAEMKDMAGDLAGKLPEIDWVGSVWGEKRWPYLQGADLFCLPSHSENFGIAVLEAAHVGTPVLTTDQTPWVEYQGLDGFFIAKPEVSSIQDTLFLAFVKLENEWSVDHRDKLANWADSNFAWGNLINDYITVYQRVRRSDAS